jgi:hypothetical protein
MLNCAHPAGGVSARPPPHTDSRALVVVDLVDEAMQIVLPRRMPRYHQSKREALLPYIYHVI